jgi:hypothetical protein
MKSGVLKCTKSGVLRVTVTLKKEYEKHEPSKKNMKSGVLRVTVTCPQNSLVRSVRTQVSGVFVHIPGVSEYPSSNG